MCIRDRPARALGIARQPGFEDNITPGPSGVPRWQLAASMAPSVAVLLYPWLAFVPRVLDGSLAGGLAGLLFLAVWPWVGMSIIWTTMTQVSHIQECCQPRPLDGGAPSNPAAAAADKCWATRQIESSLDYSVGSHFVTAAAAGLNSQSLHHVLPCLCSCHHPAIYDEYVAICARHGVRVNRVRDLRAAAASMFDYLRRANRVESE